MEAVFDNFDAYLKAFGYTFALFLASGILSLVLGTFLVAMRVGPIAVLRTAGATYVTLVRNTPLVIVFAFFSFAAPTLGINFKWLDVHIGDFDFTDVLRRRRRLADALHLDLRVRGPPVRGQRRAAGPGRGRAGDRAAVRRGDDPGRAAAGVPRVAAAAGQRPDRVDQEHLGRRGVRRGRGDLADAQLLNDFPTQRVGIFVCFAAGYVVIVEVFSFLVEPARAALEGRHVTTSVLFDAPGPRTIRRHRLYGVVALVAVLGVLAWVI